jgi:hypothetical protein
MEALSAHRGSLVSQSAAAAEAAAAEKAADTQTAQELKAMLGLQDFAAVDKTVLQYSDSSSSEVVSACADLSTHRDGLVQGMQSRLADACTTGSIARRGSCGRWRCWPTRRASRTPG